jgi:anti-sigma regulatory factor (Ser/Thr protein kinase)
MMREGTKERTRLLSVRLPARPDSVRAARDTMNALRAHLTAERLDDVRLMVSELMTNSLRHGALPPAGKIAVAVDLQERVLTVEVQDPGKGFMPHVVPAQPGGSGWGLFLVDRLSDAWGVSSDGSTRVWFQVAAPGRSR